MTEESEGVFFYLFLEFTLWIALSVHVQISLSLFLSFSLLHTQTVPLHSSWAEGFGEEPATSAEADFPRLPQGYLSMIPIGP